MFAKFEQNWIKWFFADPWMFFFYFAKMHMKGIWDFIGIPLVSMIEFEDCIWWSRQDGLGLNPR